MNTLEPIEFDSLHWIREEISSSLEHARGKLAAFEAEDNADSWETALSELRQVRGSLQMVELYGAAMVAEEIETTTKALFKGEIKDKEIAQKLLNQAITDLPGYLDDVQSGNKDVPIALLPLLDDLRECRGDTLLSERLFNPNINAVEPPAPVSPDNAAPSISVIAAKLSPAYQLCLMNCIRNTGVHASLQKLLQIIDKFAQVSQHENTRRLWWFTGGMLEALIDKGVENTNARKKLLGQIERYIRALADKDEADVAESINPSLFKTLLYVVARTTSTGPRVTQLRQVYQLEEGLSTQHMGDESSEDEGFMDSVVGSSQKTLEKVRKILEKFFDAGHSDPDRLMPLADMLDQVADTLGMLGLGVYRRMIVERQMEVVQGVLMGTGVEPDRLRAIAGALGYIEASLGKVQLESRGGQDAADIDEEADASLTDGEHRQLQEAVIREMKEDLAYIKEEVAEFYKTPDQHEHLNGVPERLGRVRGGLVMLELEKAAELLQIVSDYVDHNLLTLKEQVDESQLDDLAEIISGIEYFLETMEAQRARQEESLEGVEQPASRLNTLVKSAQEQIQQAEQNVEAETSDASSETSSDEGDQHNAVLDGASEEECEEIIEIFLEEAKEVLEVIETSYPEWKQEPEYIASLTQIRKAFHTLKGSGRMAGATAVGDFAWALENLLNQILVENYPATPAVFALMDRVVPMLAELIEGFETQGSKQTLNSAQKMLAEHAHTMSSSPEAMESFPEEAATSDSDDTAVESQEEFESGRDLVLVKIFREETQKHLSAVDNFIASAKSSDDPIVATEELHSALHTLHGSADMAEFAAIATIAGALENLVEQLKDAEIEADADTVALLEEALNSISDSLPSLENDEFDIANCEELAARAKTIQDRYPAVNRADQAEDVAADEAIEMEDVAEADEIEFVDEATPEDDVATADEAVPDMAEELDDEDLAIAREAFMEEATECLEAAEHALETWSQNPSDLGAGQEVEKQIHTFKGGARMAGMPAMGDLSHSMESLLTIVVHEGVETSPEMFELLQHALDTLQDMYQHTASGQAVTAAPELIEQLEKIAGESGQAEAELPSDTDAELEQASQAIAEEVDAESEDVTEIGEVAETEEVELVDETASADEAAEADEIELVGETVSVDEVADSDEIEIVDETASADAAALDDAVPDMAEHLDDEDLAIAREAFMEEAAECLEAAEHALQQWEQSPSDLSTGQEVEKQIHTFKGGARMAGLPAMGDLSHSMESLLTIVVHEGVETSPEMFELLQHALDTLQDMYQHSASGQAVTAAPELIEQLEKIAGQNSQAEAELPSEADNELEQSSQAISDDVVADGEEAAVTDEVAEADEIELAEEAFEFEAKAEEESPSDTEAEPVLSEQVPELSIDDSVQPAEADEIEIAEEAFEFEAEEESPSDAEAEPVLSEHASEPSIDDSIQVAEEVQTLADEEPPEVAEVIEPIADADIQVGEPEIIEEEQADVSPATVDAAATTAGDTSPDQPTTEDERIRVSANLLDKLVNFAAEASVSRSRLDQNLGGFRSGLGEMTRTIVRLCDQLRSMEIETEAQILFRHEEASQQGQDFDPLEFDRFSLMQQLSRGLQESADDLISIEDQLQDLVRRSENLLLQQGRTTTDLQDGLMRTRFEPFSKAVPRLRRVVRQTARSTNKKGELTVIGADQELDRSVINRMLPPLEHILRNAIDHGLEPPETRAALGKTETGQVTLKLERQGNEIVIHIEDDGRGMDTNAIRKRAIERGLLDADAELSSEELVSFVLESGFSTAATVTQISGRGVGMNVVNGEIKQLGGTLEITTDPGKGSQFTIRLPLTLVTNFAVLVQNGNEQYAIPFSSIEGLVQVRQDVLHPSDDTQQPEIEYGGKSYPVYRLSVLLGDRDVPLTEDRKLLPLLLVQTAGHHYAIQVDRVIGNREIVVKPMGPQLDSVRGLAGATIMADGGVVLVLDMTELLRHGVVSLNRDDEEPSAPETSVDETQHDTITAMVVDDSITVRKVTSRLLTRNHIEVVTAKDGVDALEQLQYKLPDVILLDIEMPRMDGFELATLVRNDQRLRHIPIIMITSRIGDKHRDRAMEIGVNNYLGKPFQEEKLLESINELVRQDNAKDQHAAASKTN